jgi:hypothetical protein
VGKIQERCCQGRNESSANQRAIVAAEASEVELFLASPRERPHDVVEFGRGAKA